MNKNLKQPNKPPKETQKEDWCEAKEVRGGGNTGRRLVFRHGIWVKSRLRHLSLFAFQMVATCGKTLVTEGDKRRQGKRARATTTAVVKRWNGQHRRKTHTQTHTSSRSALGGDGHCGVQSSSSSGALPRSAEGSANEQTSEQGSHRCGRKRDQCKNA